MTAPSIYIYRAADVQPDTAELSAAEQTELAVHAFGPRRRREWIRGRLAARRALAQFAGDGAAAASVLVHPDGAPRVTGCPGVALSLSHDGDYIAIALGRGSSLSVGVDLCLHSHRERARQILHRLAVTSGRLDPVVQWAAIETALKLRRMAVTSLLDAHVTLVVRNVVRNSDMTDVSETSVNRSVGRNSDVTDVSETSVVRISGLGADVDVGVRTEADYAVAWGAER